MKKIILLLLILLATGCSVVGHQPTFTLSPTLPVTMAPTVPTSIVESVTPSLLPTLSPAMSESAIFNLFEDNGNCFFPCWWGLTPNKTSAQAAISLLDGFETIAVADIFNEYGSYKRWLLPRNGLLLDIGVSISYNEDVPKLIQSLQVNTQVTRKLDEGGFEVVWENPLNEQFLQYYMLSQILLMYEQPKGVLVFANEGWAYFELVLDYSDRGFVIWYSAPLESSDDKYLGCMSKVITRLYLWAPELSYTWAEGITGTGGKYEIDSLNRDFQPLEEVTSFTPDEFYDVFRDSENSKCIETPKVYWPGP